MKIGKLECQVCVDVDGHLEPLEEYGVEHRDTEGGKTCSAWIPSRVGQRFEVVCRDPGKLERAECCLKLYIFIDESFQGKILFKSDSRDEKWVRNIRVSPTERRPWQFGTLELTDDDLLLSDNQRQYGEIKIEVWRARILDGTRVQARNYVRRLAPARVHEKSKKGVNHTVVFGDAVESVSKGAYPSQRLDDDPIATFNFRYRSIDILRASGIAPNRASQSADTNPSSSDTKSAGSQCPDMSSTTRSRKRKASEELRLERPLKREIVDIEEIERDREAVRQAEEALRQARLRLYRQEGNKRVKLEDVSAFIPGDVIDLTED